MFETNSGVSVVKRALVAVANRGGAKASARRKQATSTSKKEIRTFIVNIRAVFMTPGRKRYLFAFVLLQAPWVSEAVLTGWLAPTG